ncbi:MAG TPA: hypothetical protein VGK87_05650 [Anaerolineae bacterium]
MNKLTVDELKNLVEAKPGPFVTITLPTISNGVDTRQNPIRFRKLLRDAEERLSTAGMHQTEAQQLLEPARKLLEDTLFWQHQDAGLTVFVSPRLFRQYRMSVKPEELVIVGDHFHIKPILQLLTGNRRFYVLALSQNKVRLLDANQYGPREIELKDMPQGLDETLHIEPQAKQVQFRTLTSSRPGKGDAMFYGLGSQSDVNKEHIHRYLRQVNDSIAKYLKSSAPLVFAGVDFLFPMYKEVNQYAGLMETPISGSPDELGIDELYKRAWTIVQPVYEKARLDAADYYRQVANTPRASHRIGQVAPAAFQGRVEILFVQRDVQAWGHYAPEVGAVHEYDTPQPGSEDMLDFAATHTLLHGGTVYALERDLMPNGSSVAAVFRY